MKLIISLDVGTYVMLLCILTPLSNKVARYHFNIPLLSSALYQNNNIRGYKRFKETRAVMRVICAN